MRRTWLFILLASLCTSTGCFSFSVQYKASTWRELDTTGARRILVETGNGSVQVEASPDAPNLRCEATCFASARNEDDARSAVEAIQLELARDALNPDDILIRATFPARRWGISPGASFRLEIPSQLDLQIHTSNGAVRVRGVRGAVTLRTSNGAIDVQDVDGELDAKTSNGAIRLRGVDGGQISAVSSNGSILIEVPSDVSAELKLETSNGSVSRRLDDFQVTGLEGSRSRLRATLNGGDGQIVARTSNGGIDFRASH